VNDSLGETQAALDYYATSAAIYRRKERPVELSRLLNSAGKLYSLLGDRKRALSLFAEALAVSRKIQSRQDEAATLSKLADLYADEGETQKARDHYTQALAISREIKNRLNEATNLNRLGLLSHSEGDRLEAIRLFEEALTIDKELGTRYDGALALNNLGMAQDGSGNTKLALDYFNRALTIFREIENKNGEAMMLYRVTAAQRKLGRIDQAQRDIAAALEIVETIRGKIASTDLRSSYFSTVQQYYDLYIDLLMDEHRAHPGEDFNFQALQVSEQARARSLLDLLQEAKADVRQSVDRKLLAREKELQELVNGKAAQQTLAFSDSRKAELAKSLGEEITRLSDEYESLQAAIRKSNPRYADLVNTRPLRLAEVQKLLDPETVLLEYKLGDERSYLWLVSSTKLESFELAPRVEIETQARKLYELLTERNRATKGETPDQRQARVLSAGQKLQTVSAWLSQALFGFMASKVGNKRLVIVADGALQYVPFAALVEANEIVSLPSIAVLAQLRRQDVGRKVPEKSVAVFADPVFEADDPRLARASRRQVGMQSGLVKQSLPDFDFGSSERGLPRLFASRKEARSILALAPTGASYGAFDFDASRERAMGAELNQYRVLHFATHGLLNSARPQLSGVVLSLYDEAGKEKDGFLRLNQIYNLHLTSELVVLSACSTALGQDVKGEGLIGLTRGFMYAGARQVIASLWKVDDEATAELMRIFYRNLLREKMSAPKALRAAQVEMQSQTRWRSPYYWGAFVLQGDWR
jgi:CHAT domain-containing protein